MTNQKSRLYRVLSLFLVLALCLGALPLTASAANQSMEYRDPAETWLSAAGRTNEFNANAVVSEGTMYCRYCTAEQNGNAGAEPHVMTPARTFRVPEYTNDGVSNATRNIKYSDGVMIDEKSTSNVMYTSPNHGGIYTGYHWTKTMCLKCGRMNTNGYTTAHGYLQDVYNLYDCASDFDQQTLPESTDWEYLDDTYHYKTITNGTYCGFCFGTRKATTTKTERHTMGTTVRSELAHTRFMVTETCSGCDYSKVSYTLAKSVVANYEGVADGQPHTISVSDLSESGVRAQIRYGNSADSCTLTSAPNYIEAGSHPVYYKITYTYKNTDMVEDGVAYVRLAEESSGDGACTDNVHSFALAETVAPTCNSLGYTRFLCVDCGKTERQDYTNALGHLWQSVLIREADCENEGKVLKICQRCGTVEVIYTDKGAHEYSTHTTAATCTNPGYTVKECSVCGDRQIINITNALAHNYKTTVVAPTCENGGWTTHACEGCGSNFITDYTDPAGHHWDNGSAVTEATCSGEGVTDYRCTRCGYHLLESNSAVGHTPGAEATCTDPQLCTVCGAVIEKATGHDYKAEVTDPTCTTMGYTTYTCSRCGNSYKSDYTEAAGHKAGDWIVDKDATIGAEGSKHTECVNCGEKLETVTIPKIYMQATTDTHGEAIVGGYLVTVTDTDTKNPVSGAAVVLSEDDTLSIRLPNSRILDYADQTTITVQLVADKSPVVDMPISITDKNGNYSAGKTDQAGALTVPAVNGVTGSEGKITTGYEDADGNKSTLTVKVEHYDTGRVVEGAVVTIGKTGNITVKLPEGVDMGKDNRIIVTVTDNRKNPLEGVHVIVKVNDGDTEKGDTDEAGKVALPSVTKVERHAAYIVGYPDGTFGPEKNMTRSEAAAIFARLLAERNGDTVTAKASTKFEDIPTNAWYSGYVRYLSNYGIVQGCGENRFAPDRAITRGEFVAMAVRFFEAYGDGAADLMEQYASFSDVSSGDWAAQYIHDAAVHGWIVGYGDGTFKAGRNITRAEVVTIVNRLLGHEADKEYIKANVDRLNTFSDMPESHWAYYNVMEAANTHTATVGEEKNWK